MTITPTSFDTARQELFTVYPPVCRVALPVLWSQRRRAHLTALGQRHDDFVAAMCCDDQLRAYFLRGLHENTKMASRETQVYNQVIEEGLTHRLALAERQVEGAVQCVPYLKDDSSKQCLVTDVFWELYDSMLLVSTWGTRPCRDALRGATERYEMALALGDRVGLVLEDQVSGEPTVQVGMPN
jgi:hypothetical protein